jgi:alpha-L-rhamnosidase
MKTVFSILAFSLLFLNCCQKGNVTQFSVSEIKCNGMENPEGTGQVPVFSWIISSPLRGQEQKAWQIIVSSRNEEIEKDKGDIWDSGKTISPASAWIPYSGPKLRPGKRYFWKVRTWDKNNKPSPWSKTEGFLTGLFTSSDWEDAKWIGYEEIPDSLLLVPGVHGSGDNLGNIAKERTTIPFFRKEFTLDKKISHAYAFVCGLGQYELYINGSKIGNRFLSPGWTDYRKTCLYNTFDVTDKLVSGSNAIGTIVGNGFYNINRERYRKLVIAYGAPKMILKLEVEYSDGSSETIVSDETWKTAASPLTFSSIYGGEDYDARLEQDGWDRSGFSDAGWKKALLVREPAGTLKPENDYPLTVAEVIKCKKIFTKEDSIHTCDFGQNASGIIKFSVKGKRGQIVRITPGELLDEDSLVTQKATGEPFLFTYTLSGKEPETWMPRFTYYGFRYARISGAVPEGRSNPSGLPVISDIELLHTRNSSPQTGSFKCSNELFNSIYTLINWSIKSNLASVATDCPHREKLGWLEQTHLMGNSIKFIYDIHNLYCKIIDDMAEAQLDDGLVPDIAPEYVPFVAGFRDSPEWGSACVILPWDMYEWYGDTEAVRKAYPMMKKYVNYLRNMSKENILTHGLGDWYDLGPGFPGEAQLTPKAVTATSIWFYDAKLLARMADLLGNNEDAGYYSGLAENIRQSFNKKFLNPVTRVYSTGSQTAYAMPLFFGMADDTLKKDIVANLLRSVKENNKALTAGDIGYRYLLRVLEQEGQSRLIYEMNSKTDVPGYGYQLSKGATSLTESWAALKYVSNNHMMLGHLMEWFYSGLGGIRQTSLSSGYEDILIEPEIVGDITWAEAEYNSVHGVIGVSWKTEDGNLSIKVHIPVGCKATVCIPQADPDLITENKITLKDNRDIKISGTSNGKTRCMISSGEYLFKTRYNRQN